MTAATSQPRSGAPCDAGRNLRPVSDPDERTSAEPAPQRPDGRMRRLRASTERARTRAEATLEQVESMRPHNRVVDAVFGSVERDGEIGGALFAGAIAFRCFLLLVPYVFVVVLTLGLGADVTGTNTEEIARKAGITGLAASAVRAGSTASTGVRWLGFLVALYALIAGARNLVRALRVVHAVVWRVPLQRSRRTTRQAFGLLLFISALSILVRAVHAMLEWSLVAWILGIAILTLVPAGAWLWLSLRVFPRPADATWRDLVPGAVFVGVGLQVLQVVTVLYVARSIASKSETYGAIGAALTILIWAYILGRMLTASVALNATVYEQGRRASTQGGSTQSE